MYGQSPPTWLILLVAFVLALPSSAIVGLAGFWIYRRLFERESSVTNT